MMYRKRKTREVAMQILFAWDAQGAAVDDLASQIAQDGTDDLEVRADATVMARGAWDQLTTTDPWIERLAPKWPPKRQPGVDRALLRLASWELVSTPTPPKVVMAEAIELAKQFSTEQSAAFVNGVLDSLLKEHLALTGKDKA
jgi:transcription antitermination protein NusB